MYISSEIRARIAIGVAMASIGGGVGYILGKRNGDIFEVVRDETTTTHVEYETVVECEKCKARSDETQGTVKILKDENYIPEGTELVEPMVLYNAQLKEQARQNMRAYVEGDAEAEGLTEEDFEEERSPDTPYVITKDEWDRDEKGLTQLTLTWYANDKFLVDEQVKPVYSPETVVGRLEFGRGSGDSNTVYIRNEALGAEYEVLRLDRSYTIDILGMEAEEEAEAEDLKHSMRIPKFRD